jgi:RNA polymerase-binding transcription factor DksA
MAVKKAMSAIKAALAGKTAPAAKGHKEATVATAAAASKRPAATKAVVAKAAPAKRPAASKAVVAKAAPAKRSAPTKAVVAKAAPAKRSAPTRKAAVAKAAPAKRSAPTKATAARSTAAKSAAKTAAKTATKTATPPVSRSAPRSRAKTTATAAPLRTHRTGTSSTSSARPQRLQVREDETPWTAKELNAVRAELEADIARLRDEISEAEYDLAGLMRDAGEGAGDDQADAGTKTFEREQEISLANNARGMFEQTVHALERIVDGSYGICESCGSPIGKNRLLAFPRATLCMPCKSKQERR